ncbi:MAG: tRNA (N(6)-L-threonylcarbamoyladenosine(37)-C(2))-methylthiotransferase MtaB, partial [bacterium]
MNISFYTLGCKLNQAETDELKKGLEQLNFDIVPFGSSEDIAVIRACGVTCGASQTTREMIRRVKRNGAYVIVTGCLENHDLPEIDFVGENNTTVVEHLTALSLRRAELLCHCERKRSNLAGSKLTRLLRFARNDSENSPGNNKSAKIRKFIKIQTGCNFQCTYCIIPSFRGKSQSEPPDGIIKKIDLAVGNGCKEVILTGVNICQYKYENLDLAGLLKQVLEKTKIRRIRLGSLDPRLITGGLIKLYNNSERLLPHWHLSLQSGSNSVLKRMARGHTVKHYQKITNQLRNDNPLFSFTTDIIVGFPDETQEEFMQTYGFVKKTRFSKVHIFPFSPRPGTPANRLKPVHNQIVTDRVNKLTTICKKISKDYKKQFIEKIRNVLFENKTGASWIGYTPEYFKIKFESDENLKNEIKKIKIENQT